MATAIPVSFNAPTDSEERRGSLAHLQTLEEFEAEAAHLERQGLTGQALLEALCGPFDVTIRSPEELEAWIANGCEP